MSLPPDDHGGVGDEDPGDDAGSGSPPDPMDRVWRHPSELPALAPRAPQAARGPAPERARSVFASVGAGVIGALLTVGVLAAAGVLDQGVGTNVTNRPTDSGRAANAIAGVADRIAPAIVAVRVIDKSGRSRNGSGVCIRHAGQVLTSDRLLTGYRRIDIITSDGKVHTARMIGRDPESDLALLATDGDLEAAELAASGSLGLGEVVYTVGAVSSGAPWVSEGIVSSLAGRVATKTTTMSGLIESNALTEPTVSGGALVDEEGRVAGILMTSVSGHPAAIAVPIRFASQVADALRANGHVDHGWMGLGGELTTGGRLRITTLFKNGPAAKAGIRVGDFVNSADSQPIATIDDLMATARGHWPGDRIRLEVTRGHSGLAVTVKLARRPRGVAPTTTSRPATTTTKPRAPVGAP